MSPAIRCDEIMRLIDAALDERRDRPIEGPPSAGRMDPEGDEESFRAEGIASWMAEPCRVAQRQL